MVLNKTAVKKSSRLMRHLPRVPTTQYLESRLLQNDILFSGYRPVTYPVKENPLFRTKNKDVISMFNEDNNQIENITIKDKKGSPLIGPKGTGGIGSCGVNSVWDMSPNVPHNLLPYNWWSISSMGMEYYPEWKSIPSDLRRRLKPYDREVSTSKMWSNLLIRKGKKE